MVGVVIFITKFLSCACATPHVSADARVNTPPAAFAASCFCAKFTSSSPPDQVFYRFCVVTDGIKHSQSNRRRAKHPTSALGYKQPRHGQTSMLALLPTADIGLRVYES